MVGEGGRTIQLPQRKCRMKITRVCFVANNVENLIFFSFSSNISRSPALESVSGDMMSLFVVDMVEESQGERIRFMGTITCGDSPRTANQIARMSIWSKRHKLLQIKLRMFRGGKGCGGENYVPVWVCRGLQKYLSLVLYEE